MSLVSDLLNYDGSIESVKIYRNATAFRFFPDGRKRSERKVNIVRVMRNGKPYNITFDLDKSLNSNESFRKVLRGLYGRG